VVRHKQLSGERPACGASPRSKYHVTKNSLSWHDCILLHLEACWLVL